MMCNSVRRWIPLWVLVGMVLLGLALVGRISADGVTPRSIDRNLEPVVLTGGNLPLLQGTPVDFLFAYALRDGIYQQIPFQVDHVTSVGVYTTRLGGSLGPTDEIVFMASDLGDLSYPVQITESLPISSTWYQIEVTDSLSPTLKGWAYIVRSSSLTKTFTQTYASFDAATNQITASRYVLGFASSHPGLGYLALNGSGVDILDRTKIRLETYLGTFTEDFLGPQPIDLIKDGPVRVIARGGTIIGYSSMFHSAISTTLPAGVTGVRLSTDFNVNAAPSTFYNANTPAGVTVDGSPDTIAPSPLSPWWEVAGGTGTLVQVGDFSLAGGTQTNYYKDDDMIDPTDTGDQKSYGDTGLRVDVPNPTVVYQMTYFVLPADQPNVGARYGAYVAQPLQVTTTAQGRLHHTYLPIVIRN